jgi:SET domain-containing protein
MIYVGESRIHGKGVFASQPIPAGTPVFLAVDMLLGILPWRLLPLGTLVNHCVQAANTKLTKINSHYYLTTLRDIAPGEELFLDYRYAPWFVNRDTRGYRQC